MARSIDDLLKMTLGDLLARNAALVAELERLQEELAKYTAQAEVAKQAP